MHRLVATRYSQVRIDARPSKAGRPCRAVHVTAITTMPFPPPTDLTGADDHMTGLIQFAQAIVPGSARIIASTGDDRNALIALTVEADFGAGKVTLPGSRLYLLDDDSKIKSEHVVFYAAQ